MCAHVAGNSRWPTVGIRDSTSSHGSGFVRLAFSSGSPVAASGNGLVRRRLAAGSLSGIRWPVGCKSTRLGMDWIHGTILFRRWSRNLELIDTVMHSVKSWNSNKPLQLRSLPQHLSRCNTRFACTIPPTMNYSISLPTWIEAGITSCGISSA